MRNESLYLHRLYGGHYVSYKSAPAHAHSQADREQNALLVSLLRALRHACRYDVSVDTLGNAVAHRGGSGTRSRNSSGVARQGTVFRCGLLLRDRIRA